MRIVCVRTRDGRVTLRLRPTSEVVQCASCVAYREHEQEERRGGRVGERWGLPFTSNEESARRGSSRDIQHDLTKHWSVERFEAV